MSKNIISSFSTILENAGWLNTRTKSSVIRKVSAIAVNLEIGGDNPLSGYRTESKNLGYDRNQPFFNRVLEFEQQLFLTKQMTFQNTPVVKYLPSENGLLITQAFLNSPFLDLDSSDAINYGSLGVTIARELAHAFTPVNTRLDERGRVRVATEEQENKEKMDIEKIDFEKMDTTAQKSKNNETNNNLPRYTTHGFWSRVNGRKEEKECFDDESSALENLALIAAFHAYSEYPMSREMSCGNQRLGMITPKQQFWISYSQQFCFAESELFESWRKMVLLVPDADVFVGGTTGKIREFRESFECGVGSFGDCSFL